MYTCCHFISVCHCNGHSTCVNMSVCIDCQNNTKGNNFINNYIRLIVVMTTGTNCESCELGYFGYPLNGNLCTGKKIETDISFYYKY